MVLAYTIKGCGLPVEGHPANHSALLTPERLLRPAPLVTLLDGHPHTLAFLGAVTGAPVTCLGVSEFGQAGSLADVHRHHGLDAGSVVGAALDLVDV